MRSGFAKSVSSEGVGGFTLVEMVMALAVLAVTMTFVFAAFLSRQRSLLAQEEIARMQRNIRTGMEILERELRGAGYGFPPGVAVRLPRGLTGGVPVIMVSGLGVADGGTNAPDNLYIAHLVSAPTRLSEGMERPDSDLRVVDARGWKVGDVGLVYDGADSDLFRVLRVPGEGRLERDPGESFSDVPSPVFREGAIVARVLYAAFSVGRDPANGHTALFRTGVDPSGDPASKAVTEDIEDLQVRLRLPDGSEQDGEGSETDPSILAEAVGLRVHLAARGRSTSGGSHDAPVAIWNRTDVASFAGFAGRQRRAMEGYIGFRNRGGVP